MKKLLSVIMAFSLVAMLAACAPKSEGSSKVENNNPQSSTVNEVMDSSSVASQTNSELTRDEALEIALREVGVKRDEIRELEIEKDYENGILVYEIDFESGKTEYSFDVNVRTGAIVKAERERD